MVSAPWPGRFEPQGREFGGDRTKFVRALVSRLYQASLHLALGKQRRFRFANAHSIGVKNYIGHVF
jgi:hypothetical protein